MLELTVNGELKQLAKPIPLGDALGLWGYQERYFAVAVDGCFVARGQYDQLQLMGGEHLEILSPRQGG